MKRIYLLSNGPDRAFISFFDASAPEVPPVSLIPEGIPFKNELDFCYPGWRTNLLRQIPEEYRCEPDLWLIACSTDLFLEPQRSNFEKQLHLSGYQNFKLISDADAVKAYYQNQMPNIFSFTPGRRIAVLTMGRNDYRYDLIQNTYLNYRDDYYHRHGTSSSELDDILVNEMLREPLNREDLRFRQLSYEMGELRQRYLREYIKNDFEDQTQVALISGEGEERDIRLSINQFLLTQGFYTDGETFARSVKALLKGIHHRCRFPLFNNAPGLPEPDHTVGLVLCNGIDWYMEPLHDILDESFDCPVVMTGAHEAVIRGLEILAVPMLKIHALETRWKELCTSDCSFIMELTRLHETHMVKPLQKAMEPGPYIETSLNQWETLSIRKDKILAEAFSACYHGYAEVRRHRREEGQEAYLTLLSQLQKDLIDAIPESLRSSALERCITTMFDSPIHTPDELYLSSNAIMKSVFLMEPLTRDCLMNYQDLIGQLTDKPSLLDLVSWRKEQRSAFRINFRERHVQERKNIWTSYDFHCRGDLEEQARNEILQKTFSWLQTCLKTAIQATLSFPSLETHWYFDQERKETETEILTWFMDVEINRDDTASLIF